MIDKGDTDSEFCLVMEHEFNIRDWIYITACKSVYTFHVRSTISKCLLYFPVLHKSDPICFLAAWHTEPRLCILNVLTHSRQRYLADSVRQPPSGTLQAGSAQQGSHGTAHTLQGSVALNNRFDFAFLEPRVELNITIHLQFENIGVLTTDVVQNRLQYNSRNCIYSIWYKQQHVHLIWIFILSSCCAC